MTRPAFLFDIDGTLVTIRDVGSRAMARAMHEVWGLPDALDGISFAGATDSGVAARIGPGLDREPMWDRYCEHLERMLSDGERPRPLPGVVALLDRLAREGAGLALLSGNLRRSARLKLRAAGLEERFDWARSAFAEDGIERDELAAAARARWNGAALTVVGDTVPDVTCARHIGARVLAVGTGGNDVAALHAAAPDRFAEDLTRTDDLVRWLLARP